MNPSETPSKMPFNPFTLWKLDLPKRAVLRLKEIEREILETELDIAYRRALLDGLRSKQEILQRYISTPQSRPNLEG